MTYLQSFHSRTKTRNSVHNYGKLLRWQTNGNFHLFPHNLNQQFFDILQNANIADSTKKKYIRVVKDYLASGKELTDQNSLATYAATLSRSRRGHLKSAIRKCVEGMATTVKGQATPDNINSIKAALLRFEALQDTIQVSAVKGQKSHTWLSQREVRQLLSQPDMRKSIGRRDKIALGLCVAARFRREEAVAVQFADIERLPMKKQTYRAIINVRGKWAKDRTVPILETFATDIESWRNEIELMDCCCDLRYLNLELDLQTPIRDFIPY